MIKNLILLQVNNSKFQQENFVIKNRIYIPNNLLLSCDQYALVLYEFNILNGTYIIPLPPAENGEVSNVELVIDTKDVLVRYKVVNEEQLLKA